ncbi:10738_t:CDS:1, partial [Racocetra persica]
NFSDLKQVGRGGFGTVFKATIKRLDLTVAVKKLSAEKNEKTIQKFVKEPWPRKIMDP